MVIYVILTHYMMKNVFIFLSLLLTACTQASSQEEDMTGLSVDVDLLDFGSDGGEKTFTVTSSEPFSVTPDDIWIKTSKGTEGKDHKTPVTVTAEKNTVRQARQTMITVTAGDEKRYIEITQSAMGNNDDNAGQEGSMHVALSFDDGPNNLTTKEVLDILEEYDVPASFFVIGQNINDSTAEQMKRAVSLGCEIQNHSFTHSHMTTMSSAEVIDELTRTDDLVEKYTGTRPHLFRPPYIDQNKAMHEAIDHTFISGVGCQDWDSNQSTSMRFNDLMAKIQDGDIILLHDFYGNGQTVEALRLIIPELIERGYTLVTVSQLFEKKNISPEAHSGYVYTNVLQTGPIQYR